MLYSCAFLADIWDAGSCKSRAGRAEGNAEGVETQESSPVLVVCDLQQTPVLVSSSWKEN